MNQNFSLKCLTCETGFRVRMQAGYFSLVPFTYQCPQCKVVSTGAVELPPDKAPTIVLNNLTNCTQTSDLDKDKYAIQLSTELYTDKMMGIQEGLHSTKNMSPFMQYVMDGRSDETQIISALTEELIENIANKSEKYNAYWDLYYHGSHKYLYKKLKEDNLIDPIIKLGDFVKLSDTKKIGFLPKYLYSSLLETEYYENKVVYILENISIYRKKEYESFKELFKFTEASYKDNLNKIIEVNKGFFSYYNYILPVIVNESINSYNIDEISRIKGITQTDFENIKKYYAENYENMKDFILPCILLQNLNIRGSIKIFHPNFYRDFNKAFKGQGFISDFNRVISSVGNRIKILFYDDKTTIDRQLLESVFDNEIRNSINHQDYNYDYNKQLITLTEKDSKIDLYLIEYAEKIFSGFIFANIFWDIYMLLIDLFDINSST